MRIFEYFFFLLYYAYYVKYNYDNKKLIIVSMTMIFCLEYWKTIWILQTFNIIFIKL